MKILRVVLDTNIIISALNFSGAPEIIVDSARGQEFLAIISGDIMDELKEVLKFKFKWENDKINEAVHNLECKFLIIKTHSKLHIIKNDPSDNKILECAIDGKANYIVSGDKKHLLSLKKYKGIPILSTSEFLKILYEQED